VFIYYSGFLRPVAWFIGTEWGSHRALRMPLAKNWIAFRIRRFICPDKRRLIGSW
jgi:hypothetical protein